MVPFRERQKIRPCLVFAHIFVAARLITCTALWSAEVVLNMKYKETGFDLIPYFPRRHKIFT